MKTGIIDVGSNSVRLALMADGKTLYKTLATTRLGEGISVTGRLKGEAIARTISAIYDFSAKAKEEGADKVLVFATAAVRSAQNREEFLAAANARGITVDVISGEEEAKLGLIGALGAPAPDNDSDNAPDNDNAADGGIIDVGGASTEVSIRKGGNIVYSKSVNIGTVRLFDLAGRDREKLEKVIKEKIAEYGNFDASAYKMYTIGGTASRLASIVHGQREYRPEVTNGTYVSAPELLAYAEKLIKMPVEEIRATTICTNSADIVGGGCLLMYLVMKHFDISGVTVSESDNIEGYYALKMCNAHKNRRERDD